MAKKLLLALVAVFLALGIVIQLQPADAEIARSITIAAPPEAVFDHINDLHKMEVWSPWMKMDPSGKVAHEGSPSGVGAIQTWSGNDKVGEGKMTITESKPNELVRIDLQFYKPFRNSAVALYTLKPENGNTTVTWAMICKRTFMEKAANLVMNLDKMIGGQFEIGLTSLKNLVEKK